MTPQYISKEDLLKNKDIPPCCKEGKCGTGACDCKEPYNEKENSKYNK